MPVRDKNIEAAKLHKQVEQQETTESDFLLKRTCRLMEAQTIQESQLLRTSGALAAAAAFVIRAVALLAHTVEPVRDP